MGHFWVVFGGNTGFWGNLGVKWGQADSRSIGMSDLNVGCGRPRRGCMYAWGIRADNCVDVWVRRYIPSTTDLEKEALPASMVRGCVFRLRLIFVLGLCLFEFKIADLIRTFLSCNRHEGKKGLSRSWLR